MKFQNTFSVQFVQLLDAIVILGGLFLTFPIRNLLVPVFDILPTVVIDVPVVKWTDISPLLFGLVPLLPVFLEFFGFYDKIGISCFWKRCQQICKATLIMACSFAVLAVLLKFEYQNRSIMVVGVSVVTTLLLLRDCLMRFFLRNRSNSDDLKAPVLLIGTKGSISDWKREIHTEDFNHMLIAGEYDCRGRDHDVLESLLAEHRVEKVIFLTKETPFDDISSAVEICEEMGVDACIATNFINTKIASPSFGEVGGMPMLIVRSVPDQSWALFGKHIMDRIGAACLLVITSPIWIIAIVGIVLSDGGPVFFRQDRAGRYGKPFKMWKFRSMVRDAESKLAALKKEQGNQMSGPVFKLEDDPRIFKFGHWMRRTSVDELPQLLNVLFGEMSLVGPRPMACYEIPELPKAAHRRKLSIKPGITCIWQVEGRNSISDFDDWVKLDLKYIDEWSLALDIKILLKTIPAVLFSKGAK